MRIESKVIGKMMRTAIRGAFGFGALLVALYLPASSLVTPKRAPNGVNLRNHTCSLTSAGEEVAALCSASVQVLDVLRPGDRLRTTGKAKENGRVNHDWYEVILPGERTAYAAAAYLEEVDSCDLPFEVRFLNAGGGDAALITVGNTDVVIDGGRDPKLLLKELQPHLHGDIELLIVTHPGEEHWRGLRRIIDDQNLGIRECWIPDTVDECPDSDFARFLNTLRLRATKVVEYSSFPQPKFAGGNWPAVTPEVDFDILHNHFPSNFEGGCNDRPDDSALVFVTTVGGSRFLFTSDIRGKESTGTPRASRFVEEELLDPNISRGLTDISVLKVPHHGMETSSTIAFIDRVCPQNRQLDVVICTDTAHEPADTVIQRYRRKGVRIWQTDHGTVLCRRGNAGHAYCSYEP